MGSSLDVALVKVEAGPEMHAAMTAAKRRRFVDAVPSVAHSNDTTPEHNSVQVFLSHTYPSNGDDEGRRCLKKVLLVVKSHVSPSDTQRIVQHEIQRKLLKRTQKVLSCSEEDGFDITQPALLLLSMLPDAADPASWFASSSSNAEWLCTLGDSLRLDNRHSCDVEICVRTFLLPAAPLGSVSFIEDFRSPTVFPKMFSGSSLELSLLNRAPEKSAHPFACVSNCLTRGSLGLASNGAQSSDKPEDSQDDKDNLLCVSRNGKVIAALSAVMPPSAWSAPRVGAINTDDACSFSFQRNPFVAAGTARASSSQASVLGPGRLGDPFEFKLEQPSSPDQFATSSPGAFSAPSSPPCAENSAVGSNDSDLPCLAPLSPSLDFMRLSQFADVPDDYSDPSFSAPVSLDNFVVDDIAPLFPSM
jgi:hypothetical protein